MHKILEIITHPKCVELEGENISKVLSEWTWVEHVHGFPHNFLEPQITKQTPNNKC